MKDKELHTFKLKKLANGKWASMPVVVAPKPDNYPEIKRRYKNIGTYEIAP